MMTQRLAIGAILFLSVLAAGCGKAKVRNENPNYRVNVTVTLDDQPLPEGRVVFQFLGKAPAMGEIKNGKAQFSAPSGKCDVEIFGFRQKERRREPEQYLPARYNAESTMAIEVAANNENSFVYNLTSN